MDMANVKVWDEMLVVLSRMTDQQRKTFLFQEVNGSYSATLWIVVAESYENALEKIKNHESDEAEWHLPLSEGAKIQGINYNPDSDKREFSNWNSYYETVAGNIDETNTEGWWAVKEFYSDLPFNYIHVTHHAG